MADAMIDTPTLEQRDDRARTWQLVMTGNSLHRVTSEAQPDMARLLDLDPSISHLIDRTPPSPRLFSRQACGR